MDKIEVKKNLMTNNIENTLKPVVNIGDMSPDDEPSGCGYCKKDGKKNYQYYSFGFSTEEFTPELYEKIMFLGWRRCGDYIYRPILEKNCCKMYSIRLDVNKFKINKNQKKVIRNFKQHLIGKFNKETREKVSKEVKEKMQIEIGNNELSKSNKFSDNLLIEFIRKFLKNEIFVNFIFDELKIDHTYYEDLIKDINLVKLFPCKNKTQGQFSSTIFIVLANKFKAQLLQLSQDSFNFYKKMLLLFQKYINSLECRNDFETNISDNSGHLNFKFHNDELLNKYGLSFLNISNSITSNDNIKNQSKEIIQKKEEDPFGYSPVEHVYDEPVIYNSEIKNNYTIELDLNSNLTDEKFNIYKQYQKNIHKDKDSEITKNRYKSSWGTSNLLSNADFDFNSIKSKLTDNQIKLLPKKYGTYDLIHRLNGKIIAVGILDIMPESISSVYLYYDTDYSFLNLGIFTAIKEIEYTLFLKKYLSISINYYVMGFYIYDCQKMKYKGEYFPSEILCPKTLKFYSLDDKRVQKILKEKSNDPLSSDDPIHPNLLLDNNQLDKIIKESAIYYDSQEFSLYDFINEMINKSYVNKFIMMVRKFIKHYGINNLEQTKLIL